jgi:hypothetical protein
VEREGRAAEQVGAALDVQRVAPGRDERGVVELVGERASARPEVEGRGAPSGEIDREQWGMTWNQTLDTGGVFVGKKVRLELEVEAVRLQAER